MKQERTTQRTCEKELNYASKLTPSAWSITYEQTTTIHFMWVISRSVSQLFEQQNQTCLYCLVQSERELCISKPLTHRTAFLTFDICRSQWRRRRRCFPSWIRCRTRFGCASYSLTSESVLFCSLWADSVRTNGTSRTTTTVRRYRTTSPSLTVCGSQSGPSCSRAATSNRGKVSSVTVLLLVNVAEIAENHW